MNKTNETVKKEIIHIAIGTLIGDVLMCMIFLILKKFGIDVVIGAVIGSVFAIGNFAYLGHCVQKALDLAEGGKSYLTRTYIVRVLLHATCIILAALLPFENTIAGIVPLFLPRATIYAMQLLGMYKPEKQ